MTSSPFAIRLFLRFSPGSHFEHLDKKISKFISGEKNTNYKFVSERILNQEKMAGRLGPSGSPDAIFRRPNGLTERYQEFVKRKASLDEEKRRLKENRSSQKKTSKPG